MTRTTIIDPREMASSENPAMQAAVTRFFFACAFSSLTAACSSGTSSGGSLETGGGTSSGGAATGGTSSGGAAAGGTSSGGRGLGDTAGGAAGTTGGTALAGATTGGSSASSGSAGAPSGGASLGGTGGGSAGGGFGAEFSRVAAILEAHCGSKCHSGMAEGLEHLPRLSNLDLATLYTTLTSKLADGICAGHALLTPGQGSSSLIVRAMKGSITDPCPLARMPIGCGESGPCVSDKEIAAIEAWVSAGAPKN